MISITYSDWQRKLHAHVLKSLVEILGIFVSSYNCSVWEAGPFSLSLSFLSSHCLHCYSSQTFSGHSQASCASPVTHISVTCPEMKLSQGLWKGQTALGGWVNSLHWTFSLVAGDVYLRSGFREVSPVTKHSSGKCLWFKAAEVCFVLCNLNLRPWKFASSTWDGFQSFFVCCNGTETWLRWLSCCRMTQILMTCRQIPA